MRALVVVALQQPLASWVFVLDAVLIGAGDGRWLAWAQVAVFAAYVPLALLARAGGISASGLWWAFGGFMLARGLALGWRARGKAWLVVGATR